VSVAAAILDADHGGLFRIAPDRDGWRPKQLYLPDTNVLITRFLMPGGVGEVQDFMLPAYRPGGAPNLSYASSVPFAATRHSVRAATSSMAAVSPATSPRSLPQYGSGSDKLPAAFPGAPARRVLLAGAPVDALAEQVGVPVVAGVFLDHVHERLAQRDRLTFGVAAGEVQVVVAGELLGEGNLLAPRRPASSTTAGSATAP
jgi:hypothetical protein